MNVPVLNYGYEVMGTKLKDIDIKTWICFFFDGMINIKNLGLNKTKMNEKSFKNIFIYYIGYVTFKNSEFVRINSVNPLFTSISKINWYFEEVNRNKYLTLVSTNEIKEI